jgi:hypothetical protein
VAALSGGTTRRCVTGLLAVAAALAHVTRPGTTPADALLQLIAGPTRAEVKAGFRTYVPAGTRAWTS